LLQRLQAEATHLASVPSSPRVGSADSSPGQTAASPAHHRSFGTNGLSMEPVSSISKVRLWDVLGCRAIFHEMLIHAVALREQLESALEALQVQATKDQAVIAQQSREMQLLLVG